MLPSCMRTGMCFEIPRAPGGPFPSLSSACPGEEGMVLPPELRASALPGGVWRGMGQGSHSQGPWGGGQLDSGLTL